jgi:hypothetical protein
VYNFAKEADLMVNMEPKTQNILLGQFSAQICQSISEDTKQISTKRNQENPG